MINTLKPILSVASLMLMAFPLHAEDYTLRTFRKIALTNEFWSEGATFGDINRDGHNDVIAGPYWYEGPDFKKRHVFYPASKTVTFTKADGTQVTIPGFDGALGTGTIDKGNEAWSDNFFDKAYDFNRDGWPDILVGGFPGTDASWYENPGKEGLAKGLMWKRHVVADGVDNESIDFIDLFGDGKPVLICMHDGYIGYFAPDTLHPDKRWVFHAISEMSDDFQWYTHGLGYGDVNHDGRIDLLESEGWWEQPDPHLAKSTWTFHGYPFHLGPGQVKSHVFVSASDPKHLGVAYDEKAKRHVSGDYQYPLKANLVADISPEGVLQPVTIYGGSQMYVNDVNEDGLPDVVTSTVAHGYGLVWWEQLKEHDRFDGVRFQRHIIIDKEPSESKYGVKFSEMQAIALADIDGDGLKDIVTGKRFWGHGNGVKVSLDPESNAPAVLYWFQQVRNADGSVDFVPHLVDADSGAGTQIAVGDADGDGLQDIVVADKKGAFVFLQSVRKVSKEEWAAAQPKVRFPAAK